MTHHSPLHITRHELPSVDSTNTHAKTLAAAGAPAGTLVFAHEQTAGRGRHGNTWQSLQGNLFCSIVLRPNIAASDVGQLSFVIAVALAEALAAVLPDASQIGLKWPNDILIDGKKCAGILLESEAAIGQPLPWVVAGMGVNLAVAPEGAVSLPQAGAAVLTPAAFLDHFEPVLTTWYDRWLVRGFADVQTAWGSYAVNRGKPIRVRLTREELGGVFEGIDEHGALRLRLADNTLRLISSGEVYL